MDGQPIAAMTARWPEHTYCVCLVLGTVEIDPEHRALLEAGWHPLGNCPNTSLERTRHEDWARGTHPGITEVAFHLNAYDAKMLRRPSLVAMWGR